MLAPTISTWLERRGIHYGFVIVAIAFLTMLTSSAALGLPGALMLPLSKEFNWSTEQISSALSVRFALFGLMGPFAAILMERYGLRKVICTALAFVATAMALATRMTAFWQLVLLWGVLLGLGSGMTALVLGAVVSSRWFDTHRGFVIGILTASSATGQLIFLPFAAWLIEHFGWRTAVIPVFVGCAAVGLLALLLMQNRPEDIGVAPFGAHPSILEVTAASSVKYLAPQKLSFLQPFQMLLKVSNNRIFWTLFATFFICGLSTNGLIQTHFISLCGDAGLSAVPAASVLAMMGAFDLVGTIFSGWLSDRYDNRKLLFWYYGLRGLSLFWLPHSEFTFYGLSLFAMFYGLDWIATVPPTVKLVGATFGKERAGMVFGWVFAGHQIGAAVAAFGAGRIRTQMLTYTPALYVAGSACLLAAMLVITIRRQLNPIADNESSPKPLPL